MPTTAVLITIHVCWMKKNWYRSELPFQEFYKMKHACDSVKKGEVMACVIAPYYGQVLMEIQAPSSGIIFFAHNKPLVLQNTVVYKIV